MKKLRNLLLLLAVIAVVFGCYVGNVAYNEFMHAPWDQILGIENHKGRVATVRAREKNKNWEAVNISGRDGLKLRGTYIANPDGTGKSVILLHGLYQNRAMSIPFVDMYLAEGRNVLLIDQRGHGESEGEGTTWGLREADDIDGWVRWPRNQKNQRSVGLHGVSLGAAMALLYAGNERNGDIAFVIADSSYGNIIDLGKEKITAWSDNRDFLTGYTVLLPFFRAAMFLHTRKTMGQIEPARAVQSLTVPVLFLHGANDVLIPVQTAEALYEACASRQKYIHIFADSAHAVGIETNYNEYRRTVDDFLHRVEIPAD